jgi:hypothetical protein
MRFRILEKVNKEAKTHYYPQYKSFGIWWYYSELVFDELYYRVFQTVKFRDLRSAKYFLTDYENKDRVVKIHNLSKDSRINSELTTK